MRSRGLFWATIICIPFWVTVIWLFIAGVIALKSIIFAGLIISGPLLFLILSHPPDTSPDEQDRQPISATTKIGPMQNMNKEIIMTDSGKNRSGIERRVFQYTAHFPERRSGTDRRKTDVRRLRSVRKRVPERTEVNPSDCTKSS